MIRHCPPAPSNDPVLADWFISALSGTLAAIITGFVVWKVFTATRKTERRRASAERTAESVSKVIEASSAMTMRATSYEGLRTAVFDGQKVFTHALLNFAAREIGEYPTVAAWAIQQSKDFAVNIRPILEENDDVKFKQLLDDSTFSRLSGQISGALMRWLRDGTDKPFDPTLPKNVTDF